MVTMFFGLPRCGKTTLLTKIALDAVNNKKYEFVYSNVSINVPGVTIIDNDCIGKYALRNCLILIDEATLFADSRSFKSFDPGKVKYFMMHGHFHANIIVFTQQATGVDLKIRQLTEQLYYIKKSRLIPWISMYYPVLYRTGAPKDEPGDIIEGYQEPSLLVKLFTTRYFWRPKYYKYFNSYEEPEGFKELPPRYYVQFEIYDNKGFRSIRQLQQYKLSQIVDKVRMPVIRILDSFSVFCTKFRKGK